MIATGGDWIEKTGARPVEKHERVDIMLANGKIRTGLLAITLYWELSEELGSTTADVDILRWRLSGPKQYDLFGEDPTIEMDAATKTLLHEHHVAHALQTLNRAGTGRVIRSSSSSFWISIAQ